MLNFCVVLVIFNIMLIIPGKAHAGPYTDSAHANAERRSIAELDYPHPKGVCVHCHEQHASIDGAEPEPAGGPSRYALFAPSFVHQTDNFCLKCHDNTADIAYSAITNRSYSYRAGGLTSDSLAGIKEAFDNPPSVSSHNLNDIKAFISGRWNYSANSNPCAACHNPHSTQGDPYNSPAGTKTSSARGWPVSRPALHSRDNKAWGLWGDNASNERMSAYIYQAPYRVGALNFEPAGDQTQDGSNLTDYVAFCMDCHTDQITGSEAVRKAINWGGAGDRHGGKNSAVLNVKTPYQNPASTNHVLACTDCHEPHGSPNPYLLRPAVNGVLVSFSGGQFYNLCAACHTVSFASPAEHIGKDASYNCSECHKHGTSF